MKTSVQGLKSLASKPTITKSQFPRAPFLVVRLLQFISACVVLGINGYFIYNLVHDHYSVPWEFTLLDIVAAFTLINVLITSICVCCTHVSALAIMVVDPLLCLFWAVSFGVFAHSLGSTIKHSCTTNNWGTGSGVRVCNMFKASYAFALVSIFLHVGSFIIAVIARKREASHHYAAAAGGMDNNGPAAMRQQKTAYDPLGSRLSIPLSEGAFEPTRGHAPTPAMVAAAAPQLDVDIPLQQYPGDAYHGQHGGDAYQQGGYGGGYDHQSVVPQGAAPSAAAAVARQDSLVSRRTDVSGSLYSQGSQYNQEQYRDQPARPGYTYQQDPAMYNTGNPYEAGQHHH